MNTISMQKRKRVRSVLQNTVRFAIMMMKREELYIFAMNIESVIHGFRRCKQSSFIRTYWSRMAGAVPVFFCGPKVHRIPMTHRSMRNLAVVVALHFSRYLRRRCLPYIKSIANDIPAQSREQVVWKQDKPEG